MGTLISASWKGGLTAIVAFFIIEAAVLFIDFERNIESVSAVDNQKRSMTSKLVAVDFEVYGEVQGVFFRKHTQKKAKELGVRGWCMNTSRGTVLGQMEGEKSKVDQMKLWLQKEGSPDSHIDKAEFRNEKRIDKYTYVDFSIRR